MNNTFDSRIQPIDNPYLGTTQQKRQSSLSSQMVNPSNKRIPNPLQTPLGMQQPNQDTYQFNTNNSTINSPLTPQVTSPRYNIRTRKNIVQHMKTPTPSAYEVPSSPNVNQLSHLSNQNHSDSSDSNPVLDHTNQDPNQTHHIQQQQQQQQQMDPKLPSHSYSHQQHLTQSTISQHQAAPPPPQQPQQQQQQPIPPQQQPPQQQQQQQARTMSDEEQQLATKLKETYKNIVNFEEVVQKNCIEITMKINQLTSSNNPSLVYGSPMVNQNLSSSLNSNSSLTSNSNRTSELSNDLWTVYHHNITLLDNYYDFLVTSLKPSSNQTQFKTGKNIVELYKIPRRMWVYGIVGFLEVLKNIMGIFQDHEICSCFISYCFNFISNLTDPVLEMEGWWSEKLGDLSRMAIALYASKFIDWKISAEYWYSVAMKTLYGHGKIYYHMCTVQQDNLDALVNIGKSVICRDPFVPTQHYLRLVVENICTQRNILSLLELPIIDFIKIHKVLLSIHNGRNDQSSSTSSPSDIHDSQLQYGIDLVTRYGLTFGSDSNGYNFFTRELYAPGGVSSVNDPSTSQYYQQQSQVQAQSSLPQQMQQPPPSATNTIEKMNFWFNKGSLFAISNINHLIGFGDAKNPFAKLFQLPEALKERKDKKDRKRKSRSASQSEEPNLNNNNASGINNSLSATMGSGGVDGQSIVAADLSANDWFYCLQFINKSVLELSMRILNHYLIGPKQASTAHVIVWLYFLISVGEGVQKYPASKPMVNWLLRHLFPWESLINYLNSLLAFVKNSPKLCAMYTHYLQIENYIDYFNQNEFLPEVWKCWGTLWFDLIAEKSDYIDLKEAGVKNNNLFDLPICGTYPVISNSGSSITATNNNNNLSTGDNFDMKSRNQMENDNDERIIRIILLARTIADNYGFGLTRTTSEFKFDENVYFQIINDINGKEFIADNRFQQNNFIQPISSENLTSETNNNLTSIQKDEVWFGGFDSHLYDDENIELGEDIIDIEDDLEEYPDNVYGRTTTNGGGFNTGVPGNDLYTDSFIGTPTDLGDNEDYEGNFGDKIDSNVTHITLDTNIWLKHCGRIFKCVRNGVIKVSIPLIVFQELRALRKSSEATIADAATRSVIIVRELYLAREIVPLRFDGTVASDINETAEFENNSTWRSNVDETILHSVNEHDEMGKRLMKGLNLRLSINNATSSGIGGDDEYSRKVEPPVLNSRLAKLFKYCILVTDDRNMRLRAKTIGLTSFHSKWLFTQLETVFPDRCID